MPHFICGLGKIFIASEKHTIFHKRNYQDVRIAVRNIFPKLNPVRQSQVPKALHCSMDMLFTGILSEGEANHFIVTATERVLMDEILQAVQNYLKYKK